MVLNYCLVIKSKGKNLKEKIMKRLVFNFRNGSIAMNFQRLALVSMFVFVFENCLVFNVDAQRHRGGEGRHREPSWQYSNMPVRGAYFRDVPHGSVRFYHRGHDFYFREGLFYRPYHAGFQVVAPPFGLRVGILPRACLNFYIGRIPYYYYCGTYYIKREGQYEVVAPPVGAVIESLPQGYETVYVDGQTFYTLDGVQYKPILKDGEMWYEVIKSPAR